MKYGFVLPGGTATEQLEQALIAEDAGWDGIFAWEGAYGVDAWSLLSAIATRSERIRLGTMLTPLPWRRPWKVASQVATLDELSNGRAILAVGLGAVDTGLGTTGEEEGRRPRAEMLDEGIDLIRGLWEGKRRFSGKRYTIDLDASANLMTANPVQARIPIWVVGVVGRSKSMQRVLRCDGIIPAVKDETGHRDTRPDDLRAMLRWLRERGGAGEGFDVIAEGETSGGDAQGATARIGPLAEAGATWWLETRWGTESGGRAREVRQRLAAGPPRIN